MLEVPTFVQGMQEVSSIENGAKVLFATDDFFAVAENMLKPEEPHWNEEYTQFGKWMDGWETRRKRTAGHDWVIISLATISKLTGVCVDTAFFTGNYAPRFSLQAAYLSDDVDEDIQNRKNKMGTSANNEDLTKAEKLHSENWETLIPMTTLRSGSSETRKNYFKLNSGGRSFSHLRLNIFPDGGIARLRVYGQPSKSTMRSASLKPIQGKCVQFSNAHYGSPDVLLKPTPSKGMFDGWETARRLDRPANIEVDENGFTLQKGEEWAIFKLDRSIYVKHIEVDTSHFIGNCPNNVEIEVASIKSSQNLNTVNWESVLRRTKLRPNETNALKNPVIELISKPINYVKVTIAPDGGLARLRIYGSDA